MPSKWPGEWEVGQVDFVQFVGSRGAYEVDLLPLKPIGTDLYCMPGRKPQLVRADVAKLGRLPSTYVPERDAYRVNPKDLEPLGGRKKEDPDVTAQGARPVHACPASPTTAHSSAPTALTAAPVPPQAWLSMRS